MEKLLRQSLLYDFYGELLTDHQKGIYEDVVLNDLSYSEIARLNDVSRQGVYDIVKRCDKILEDYEEKLHLVEKFLCAKEKLHEINDIALKVREINKDNEVSEYLDEILKKSQELFEEI